MGVIMKKKTLKLNSINWRMPFNYAVIAIITALSLGTVMMIVLTSYYNKLERTYLQINAISMQPIIESMIYDNYSQDQINSQLTILSLLTQTQIKLMDQNERPLADSGQISDITQVILTKDFNGYTIVKKVDEDQTENSKENVVLTIRSAPMGGYWISNDIQPSGNRVSTQKYLQPIVDGSLSIELSNGPAYGSDVLRSVTLAWSLAAIFSGLIAIISGILISRQVTLPVQYLNLATQNMEKGQLSTRVSLEEKNMDEFTNLANSFNAMAERIEKTVSTLRDFVSDAAHEINTPLTAIKINLELAENESNSKKKEYYIHNAHQNCIRLEQLSENLLDLSRIESNHSLGQKTIFVINTFLQEISEPYASQAEQKNIDFKMDLADTPIQINANKQQITQAISNLLENALKFTPKDGAISVSLKQEENSAVITISDNGIGIPEDDVPHLFERFHRGRNTNQYPGNGLGLAIVKAIIDAHQGVVKVIPVEKGCCFQIMLPTNH
jgi:signal transduction histidine kinase